MKKKIAYGLLIGGLAALAAVSLWGPGVLDRWEYLTWAIRVAHFASHETPSSQVKVVLIDQASLDWGKKENGWPWPWPREVYGPILDFCSRSGAKAVAFDMLYTEPSMNGVGDDEALGAAIQRSPPFAGAVVLGNEAGDTTAWPEGMPVPSVRIEGFEAWLKDVNQGRLVAPTALFPVPEVATNVAMLANVMDLPDRDSVYRRASLFRVFDGHVVPSLGLAAYLAAEEKAGKPARLRIERGWLHINEGRIPIDDEGRAILRFKGKTGAHESFAAAAVIQSELRMLDGQPPTLASADVFRDSYVFLGPSAPALLDLRATPLSKVAPGVEIHATMLDNLLGDLFLRDAPGALVAGVAVLLSILCGVAVTLSKRVSQSVLMGCVFLPIPVFVAFVAYAKGFWWPLVPMELSVLFSLAGAIVLNYATEGRQKQFIKGAFKHYLSAEVIEQIMRDPSSLKLGGERRELTIFFSDLQGFSTISERLGPEDLTKLLNDYLSDMTDIILEEGGTLDKYEGDAIIAFWNAPLAQDDHAVRAVRASVRCQRKLAERRAEFEARTGAVLKMRIGLNTGAVVVGNMGSSNRFDYTVLGDAANLASRLEGANKALGTYMMVAESTWAQTKGAFPGRELGYLRVVGRKTPVRVYEATGLEGEAAGARERDFEKALSRVREGRFAEAAELFEKLQDEAAAKTYAAKCRALVAAGPGVPWDGIWNLTEK